MARFVVLGVLFAFAAAGCGGGGQSEAEKLREIERELATVPNPPGLGEAAPPPPLTAGWKTDFSKHGVPLDEFMSGGPPKDGIPAIDNPRFMQVADVDFLEDREPVIELAVGGRVHAYPLQILVWHEIVNDRLGDVPVAVTFCPLCNTAIVFDRRIGGRTLDFGTTGNLRNSDLVMYDRQTESWWQQFGGAALVGELTGSRLQQLPARIVAWGDFRRAHPEATVLSRDTGHSRPYGRNPYAGYDSIDSPPFFPAKNADDDRLPPKERVVYVERGGEAVVVPFTVLTARRQLTVEVGGDELTVRWRPGTASALDQDSIADGRDVGSAEVIEDGRLVAFDQPFWFAVAAFRPDARIEP
jgi:hypothetical protein